MAAILRVRADTDMMAKIKVVLPICRRVASVERDITLPRTRKFPAANLDVSNTSLVRTFASTRRLAAVFLARKWLRGDGNSVPEENALWKAGTAAILLTG